jgi:hypothetical protein
MIRMTLSLWKLFTVQPYRFTCIVPTSRKSKNHIYTYSEEEYMLNDTLELNIAVKLYNKCQTDVNNNSNKCSGPNLMDRIIEVYG